MQPSKPTLAISVAFDAQGNLWRVSEKGGLIWVDTSRDLGKTFSKPVQVNAQPKIMRPNEDIRPKIAFGPEGNIYLTWTENIKKPSAHYIWFARSINQGKAFEKPYIIHQDRVEIAHHFNALNVSQNGSLLVAWVDNSDLVTTKSYNDTAIYYAASLDNGVSFAPEKKLIEGSSECCHIALTNKPDGKVVAMWRHVFKDGERDYMIAEISHSAAQVPVIQRATFSRWKIDDCSHHSAALASGGEAKDWWGYHMAWFDHGNEDANKKASLFYARMDGEAWVSSPAKKFGNQKNQASQPALLSLNENVWLVWRETETETNMIMGTFSGDGGRSWGEVKIIFRTADQADYPQLITKERQAYLAWNTLKDGLQLMPL
ncbi:MAG: exo-alpha-sialidase [Methylotenera sp.]|nr:exo-alpha-sialidase [Methylotenera sp.]MSP99437.1 exo-alpha-sialidase [Methylotenera sp.]